MRKHLFDRDIAPLRSNLLGFCVGLTRDRARAEDLQQEVLLRGYRAVADICAPIRAPRAYLFRTAVNLWIQWGRRPSELLMSTPLEETLAVCPGPSRREVADGFRFLQDVLPPTELRTFVLRDLLELSTREVSEALATSEAAVKMAVSRARRRLRAARAGRTR